MRVDKGENPNGASDNKGGSSTRSPYFGDRNWNVNFSAN
jgi:hypothetical protein